VANVLVMSQRERDYAAVIKQVAQGRYSAREAAELLKITRRHVFRLLERYQAEGDAGLIHRLRGRPSNHGYPKKLKERVLALYWRPQYRDYGPTLFSETLIKEHKIWVHRETMRRWLNASGGSNVQRRKRPHRKKRPRRTAVGELVQFDGSDHDWFEGRGPNCTLLHMIDDATSRAFMRFAPSENTADCMRVFWAYVERYGLPRCLYVDQDGVYCPEKEGSLTEFGRAMAELGVQIIYAHSPEAKGRVERGNRTHQDRLVKAMRRKGIASIGAANRFLEQGGYLAEHNEKFSLPTDGLPEVHRPVPEEVHLERVLCFQTTRYLRRDYTINLDAQYVQIEKGPYALPRVTDHVIVRRYLDDSLHIFSRQEEELRFTILLAKPSPRKPPVVMPAANHPWRLKRLGDKRKQWRRRR
jgi:transposase